MKFKGKENIREYIMEMSHIASKLKVLTLELSEDLLVCLLNLVNYRSIITAKTRIDLLMSSFCSIGPF